MNTTVYADIREMKKYALDNKVPIMQDDGIDFLTTFVVKHQINSVLEIGTAIQTIKFTLDDVGGKIKSEAGMDVMKSSLDERYFYVDKTFAIFLKEKSKDKPYFAARVNDIRKFQ